MTTGERIRDERRASGLTQQQLSDLSGTALITIQQYEAGKRQPKAEQLQRIATALSVTVGYLLGQSRMIIPKRLFIAETDEPDTPGVASTIEAMDKSAYKMGVALLQQDMTYARIRCAFEMLNDVGKSAATHRVEELTYVPWYTSPDKEDNDNGNS